MNGDLNIFVEFKIIKKVKVYLRYTQINAECGFQTFCMSNFTNILEVSAFQNAIIYYNFRGAFVFRDKKIIKSSK